MALGRSLSTTLAAVCCYVGSCSTSYGAEAAGVSALRIVTPNGRQSTLIGSLHVGLANVGLPALTVFQGARRYVKEHHDGTPQPVDDVGNSGRLAPWAEGLTDGELKTYFERARCAGKPQAKAAELLTYRSVQSANEVAYTVCGDSATAWSRDLWMSVAANHLGLRVDVLEDANWVEKQRHQVSNENAAAALRWILQRDPLKVLSEVGKALNSGDYERIVDATRASWGIEQSATARDEDLMVRQRNEAWMPRLKRYLDEGDAVILVGAMHLPGQTGLAAMLSAEGYQVFSVMLPAIH